MSVFGQPRKAPGKMYVLAVLPTNPRLVPKGLETLVAKIVSVEHRRINCAWCQEQCWIGPTQLRQARDPRCEVICYVCMARDPELHALVEQQGMTPLDPEADNKPRRSSSWLVTE